jgi:protein ImuB
MPRFIAIFSSNPSRLDIAQRLSPRIEICPANGLLLEVTARFEGKALKKLLQYIHPLKVGISSTRITAILAAQTQSGTVVPPGKERGFLASLPVHLLSLVLQESDCKLFSTLSQWGIRTLGELAALPEEELVARLGQAGLRLQKMARGQDVESFPSPVKEPHFEESQELEWTLDSLESLTFLLGRILEQLCARLQNYGLSVRALHLVLRLDNRTVYKRTLPVAFPTRHPKLLLSLLRLDLQSHPPNSGIVGVSLQAIPAPPRFIQYSLLEPSLPNPEKVSHTLGRLTALHGKSNIGSPALRDTHRPDAIEKAPFGYAEKRNKKQEKKPAGMTQLSLRRFRPPRPTSIRSHQVVTSAGPWRSSGDWWTGTNHEWARDEWDVELLDGSICRIYWDHFKKAWFLEGIYD